MINFTAVKAFVWKEIDEKINLLVCYFLNDTVYVSGLDSDPTNARPWLDERFFRGSRER